MGRPAALLALLAALACLLSTTPADAAPMFTDFATIRAEVRDVVIGTVRRSAATGLTIDVDKVVQGSATAPSVMVVKDAPSETVRIDGERVLAFVDKSSQLRWVGQAATGQPIETGVLHLHGFFDFNAHLVAPGIASLGNVKTLLATGALTQTYVANLSFPDGHGGLHTSTKQLTLQYDVTTSQGVVTGFAPTCLSLNRVFQVNWGKIELVYTDACATATSARSRELTLTGTATGVDAATGNLLAVLTPTTPFLEEHDYDTFIADASYASVTRVIDIGLPDGTSWGWRLGEGVVDRTGKLHAPGGWSSFPKTGPGGKDVQVETYAFSGASLTLTSDPKTSGLGDDDALIQAVQGGTLGPCSFSRGGLAPVTCTLSAGTPIWLKR